MFLTQTSNTSHVVDDNDVGCHRSNMCVMCSTSVPTLFQYFFYDHIPTFLYIFHEMFFITCIIIAPDGDTLSLNLGLSSSFSFGIYDNAATLC